MVAVVASLRRLPRPGSGHMPPRPWWAGATALTLTAVVGGVLSGWRPADQWLVWAQILVVGLALSARRREFRLHAIPLHRVLLWAVFGSVVLEEIVRAGRRLGDWDVLFVSGVLAFVVAVGMVDKLPNRLAAAATRLADRGVLIMNRDARNRTFLLLQPRAGRWAKAGGPAVSVIILLAWMAIFVSALGIEKVFTHLFSVLFFPELIFDCVCGWFAGVCIADMFAAGRSWRSFRQEAIGWRLIPGHPDGAGGFRPIGNFFFFQCLIAGIPAVYLGVWGLLIPLFRAFRDYALWFRPYLVLLAVAIALELLVFILPMWSVHTIMRAEKAKLLSRADGLSIRIDSMHRQLRSGQRPASNSQQVRDSIAGLEEEYERIEQAPTWPIDRSIRRLFNLSNIALILPFFGYVFGGKDIWQEVSKVFAGIR